MLRLPALEGFFQATLVVVVALVVDLVVSSRETGTIALFAMAAAVVGLTGATGLRWRARVDLPTFRSLVRLEVLLALGCALFALGRGVLLYETWFEGSGSESVRREAARLCDLVFLVLLLAADVLMWRTQLFARALLALGRRPHLLLATSFAAMIATSTLLLCLPWSLENVRDVSFLDALFTSTSAVCVTGLVVNDVGAHYSAFGELVILLAIQCGGIGIMSLGAAALTFTQNASLRAQAGYARLFDARGIDDLRQVARTVVVSTLAIEAVGATILWLAWRNDPALDGRSPAWQALFHAVSAFCNAGFSLFPDNLVRFRSDGPTQIVIGALVVLGGLGFPVYLELGRRARRRVRAWLGLDSYTRIRFALDARIVLITTSILLVGGACAFAVLEWSAEFAPLGVLERCGAALFSSVTCRTAGFNTIDFGALRAPTLIVAMMLMWIGGSPSSTAGGIKTSAAAVLFATFVGEVRGHEPRLGRYVIAPSTVRRASAVATLSLFTLGLIVLTLSCTEDLDIVPLTFEAVSAFATVGLSMGITSDISHAGRLVLIAAMFIGRVGPMTVALGVGSKATRERFRLATRDVSVW